MAVERINRGLNRRKIVEARGKGRGQKLDRFFRLVNNLQKDSLTNKEIDELKNAQRQVSAFQPSSGYEVRDKRNLLDQIEKTLQWHDTLEETAVERITIDNNRKNKGLDESKRKGVKKRVNESMDNTMIQIIDRVLNKASYRKVNGKYEIDIIPDYRDDEAFVENIEDIFDGTDNPEEVFYEMVNESYIDWEFDIYSEIIHVIGDELEEIGVDSDEYEEEIREYVDEKLIINYPYDHFLDIETNAIVVVDTGDGNYDYTLNPSYSNDFGADGIEDEASILWLAKTQGYSKQQVEQYLERNNELDLENSKFLRSVVGEANNTTSHMNALTFLCRATVGDLINFNENKSGSIKVFANDSVGGFVDFWSGAGSMLDLKLEKDVVIPANLIGYFGVDGGIGYGVDSIYGFTRQVWDNRIEVINNVPNNKAKNESKKVNESDGREHFRIGNEEELELDGKSMKLKIDEKIVNFKTDDLDTKKLSKFIPDNVTLNDVEKLFNSLSEEDKEELAKKIWKAMSMKGMISDE